MLGNIDPALRSRLEAINLVALFKTELLQKHSIDVILKPFISDIKKLAPVGIIIKFFCINEYLKYSLDGVLLLMVRSTVLRVL